MSKSATNSSSERVIKIHYGNVNSSSSSEKPQKFVSTKSLERKINNDLEINKSLSSDKLLSNSDEFNTESSRSSHDEDDLTPRRIHESLMRLRKSTVQPFTFFNILGENTFGDHIPVETAKPTEIDLKLEALTRRVQLNKSLLERTNERVKEINFFVERNALNASKELFSGEGGGDNEKSFVDNKTDIEAALNITCPGIMELKRTINVTKDMLTYVKKICNNEMEMTDLPEELSKHMMSKGESEEKANTEEVKSSRDDATVKDLKN